MFFNNLYFKRRNILIDILSYIYLISKKLLFSPPSKDQKSIFRTAKSKKKKL